MVGTWEAVSLITCVHVTYIHVSYHGKLSRLYENRPWCARWSRSGTSSPLCPQGGQGTQGRGSPRLRNSGGGINPFPMLRSPKTFLQGRPVVAPFGGAEAGVGIAEVVTLVLYHFGDFFNSVIFYLRRSRQVLVVDKTGLSRI